MEAFRSEFSREDVFSAACGFAETFDFEKRGLGLRVLGKGGWGLSEHFVFGEREFGLK